MISKGSSQFGETVIGAVINLFFITEKECKYSLSKLNSFSLTNRLHKGFENFEKSLINLLLKPTCPRKLLTPLTFTGGGDFLSP